MSQTKLHSSPNSLLDDAIDTLRPEVFSHPVWVRFGNKECIPPETVKSILDTANQVQSEDPDVACQIMLIGAACLNNAGQDKKALVTIQDELSLAERYGLNKAILWGLWGASAVCVQHKSLQEAAEYLLELEHQLNIQNEWILADYVDVVRQAVISQARIGCPGNDGALLPPSQMDLLESTFQWLNIWGYSDRASDQSFRGPGNKTSPPWTQLAFQRWKGSWRSLKLMFKGELKIHWLAASSRQERKRSSSQESILNLMHMEVTAHEDESVILDGDSNAAESIIITPEGNRSPITALEPEINTVPREDRLSEIYLPQRQVPVVIPVSVHMLGNFGLSIQEAALNLPPSRSLSLLKYLLLNHKQNTPREMLIDIFWPDVSMERGRNNLNVAMNGIRTALRMVTDVPVILYKDNAYGVAPEMQFWLDVEEFERLVAYGRRWESQDKLKASVDDYESALSLYQGDFLEENPYDNWTVLPRERLRLAYLDTLDRLNRINFNQKNYAMCVTLSQLILRRDRCREDAHCMLMRCYSRQGQDHLALRQYQSCMEALRLELDVTPAPETTKLYEQIRLHKRV